MPTQRPALDDDGPPTAVEPRPTITNIELPAAKTELEMPAAVMPASTVVEMPALATSPEVPQVTDEVTRRDRPGAAAPEPAPLVDNDVTDKRLQPSPRVRAPEVSLPPPLTEPRPVSLVGIPVTRSTPSMVTGSTGKKLHPLVPFAVVLAVLAVLLIAVSWLRAPASSEESTIESKTAGIKRLFDW